MEVGRTTNVTHYYYTHQNVGDTARTQVASFLSQFHSFATSSTTSAATAVHTSLEHLCGGADALCGALGVECEAVEGRDAERVRELAALEKDCVALKSEVAALLGQYKVSTVVCSAWLSDMFHC